MVTYISHREGLIQTIDRATLPQYQAYAQYEFETLEHQIRRVIIDEQEHAFELAVLLAD